MNRQRVFNPPRNVRKQNISANATTIQTVDAPKVFPSYTRGRATKSMACDATLINCRSIEFELNGLQWVAITLHVLTAAALGKNLLPCVTAAEYPFQL